MLAKAPAAISSRDRNRRKPVAEAQPLAATTLSWTSRRPAVSTSRSTARFIGSRSFPSVTLDRNGSDYRSRPGEGVKPRTGGGRCCFSCSNFGAPAISAALRTRRGGLDHHGSALVIVSRAGRNSGSVWSGGGGLRSSDMPLGGSPSGRGPWGSCSGRQSRAGWPARAGVDSRARKGAHEAPPPPPCPRAGPGVTLPGGTRFSGSFGIFATGEGGARDSWRRDSSTGSRRGSWP